MSTDLNELRLIENAKNGDDVSFELLIKGCMTKAYNTALRFMRNEQDAADALQESLIKVFRHMEQFKGECRFDTWVYRIVVNTCNDMLRKNAPLKETDSLNRVDEEGDWLLELKDPAPAPEALFESKEAANRILRCLDLISAEHKEVIVLRDIQGFSYEEIGQIIDCSEGTVKSRINRARQRLRSMILEQNEQEFV
ncbi:MAG: sigma-70 family RNA polymerase sigma factor [Eubacteriales bacterium]|nr:sigma-70 family RNA polymerase sigma factor [Eubacteriales bacterium]